LLVNSLFNSSVMLQAVGLVLRLLYVLSLGHNNGSILHHLLGGSLLNNNSVLHLQCKSCKESQGNQSKSDDGAIPGNMGAPFVVGSSIDETLFSDGSKSISSTSKNATVGIFSSKESSSNGNSSKQRSSDGDSSKESILSDDITVESLSVVERAGFNHSSGENNDGSDKECHCENCSDDHEESASLHGGSVLVSSEVEQMNEDQPGNPSNDHEDQNCCVNPLKGSVVLVVVVTGDA